MPSKETRKRGDQFLIRYPNSVSKNEILKAVTNSVNKIGFQFLYLIISDKAFIIKSSSWLLFYNEDSFKIKKEILSINFITGQDAGFFEAVEDFKKDETLGSVEVLFDNFKQNVDPIIKDDLGGYMFKAIRRMPNFDPIENTRFGRGYRRVDAIYNQKGVRTGYTFTPFSEYTDEWAAEIFGYESYEDALKSVYPIQLKERPDLKLLYMTRPRVLPPSTMVLTEWQQHPIIVLDSPVKYDRSERTIHWYADLRGLVGKSMLLRHILATRDDTFFISCAASLKDLIFSVKDLLTTSTKIKNIVFDLPREILNDQNGTKILGFFGESKDEADTIKFMEKCLDGLFSCPKYASCSFPYEHGIKIIVLTNSFPLLTAGSLDRWEINMINDQESFHFKELTCNNVVPRITTKKDVMDFYMKNPDVISYLIKNNYKFPEPALVPIRRKIDDDDVLNPETGSWERKK